MIPYIFPKHTFFFLYCPADLTKAFPLLAMFHKPTLMLIFSGSRNVLTTRIKKEIPFWTPPFREIAASAPWRKSFFIQKIAVNKFPAGKKTFFTILRERKGQMDWQREDERARERFWESEKSMTLNGLRWDKKTIIFLRRNFFIFFVTRLCQTCHRDNDNDTDTDETILERKNGRTRWAVQGKKHDVADAEDDDDH